MSDATGEARLRDSAPSPCPLRILHLILRINETSAPYNEHCLTRAPGTAATICTFFPSAVAERPPVPAFEGDGSARGFLRSLRRALASAPFDVIHVHAVHFAPFLLRLRILLGRSLPPIVFTLHTSYPNVKPRNRLLALLTIVASTRVICCSQASLESLPSLPRRLAGKRLGAIQNGVDLARIDRVLGVSIRRPRSDGFTLVSVGRLIPVKNPRTLLHAFLQAGDATSRLVFIGDGDLRSALEAEALAGGVQGRVRFAGLVPRRQVFEMLASADALATTSQVEGLPVATLEAMASRLPVVLSDIAAHREIAGDVDFIPLVPPDDTAGFAREILRLRGLGADRREEIGRRCRALVEAQFTLSRMHDRYAALYAEVSLEAVARRPGS